MIIGQPDENYTRQGVHFRNRVPFCESGTVSLPVNPRGPRFGIHAGNRVSQRRGMDDVLEEPLASECGTGPLQPFGCSG